MDNARLKMAISLALGALAIAGLCLIIIFIMRGCSSEKAQQGSSVSSPTSQAEDADPKRDPAESTPGGTADASDFEDYEDNSCYGSTGNYANDKVLVYNYGSGTISVGVEGLGVQDYIYLNPVCSEAKAAPGKQIGFFITASSPRLDFSHFEGGPATSALNAGEANLVLLSQTYDTAAPAGYKSEDDYGARWERDVLELNQDDGGTTLYIRAVNVSNGQLVAMCKAIIAYDKARDTYFLSQLISSDVVDTGEMSMTEKAALVQKAKDFMMGTGNFTPPDENYWTSAIETAKVEHVPGPYFPQFSDINGQRAKAYDFPYNHCEVWAVNFQFPSGFITVYFSPRLQTLGLDSTSKPGSEDLELTAIGYDCLNPMTQDTILW